MSSKILVKMHFFMTRFLAGFLISLLFSSHSAVAEDYTRFISHVFEDIAIEDKRPKKNTLWLTKKLKLQVSEYLNYSFVQLRLRYWGLNHRTLWILEEVGKEQPITMGVVIEEGKLLDINVLDYRESRGGEIQHKFFTDQFRGAELVKAKKRWTLSKKVDGITGATLSVRASKKVATLALFLHSLTPYKVDGET